MASTDEEDDDLLLDIDVDDIPDTVEDVEPNDTDREWHKTGVEFAADGVDAKRRFDEMESSEDENLEDMARSLHEHEKAHRRPSDPVERAFYKHETKEFYERQEAEIADWKKKEENREDRRMWHPKAHWLGKTPIADWFDPVEPVYNERGGIIGRFCDNEEFMAEALSYDAHEFAEAQAFIAGERDKSNCFTQCLDWMPEKKVLSDAQELLEDITRRFPDAVGQAKPEFEDDEVSEERKIEIAALMDKGRKLTGLTKAERKYVNKRKAGLASLKAQAKAAGYDQDIREKTMADHKEALKALKRTAYDQKRKYSESNTGAMIEDIINEVLAQTLPMLELRAKLSAAPKGQTCHQLRRNEHRFFKDQVRWDFFLEVERRCKAADYPFELPRDIAPIVAHFRSLAPQTTASARREEQHGRMIDTSMHAYEVWSGRKDAIVEKYFGGVEPKWFVDDIDPILDDMTIEEREVILRIIHPPTREELEAAQKSRADSYRARMYWDGYSK